MNYESIEVTEILEAMSVVNLEVNYESMEVTEILEAMSVDFHMLQTFCFIPRLKVIRNYLFIYIFVYYPRKQEVLAYPR